MPPLTAQQTKPFNFSAPVPAHGQENMAFKVYIDGALYGSYPIKAGSKPRLSSLQDQLNTNGNEAKVSKSSEEKPFKQESVSQNKHYERENSSETEAKNSEEAGAKPSVKSTNESESPASAEEKTMKDLEY